MCFWLIRCLLWVQLLRVAGRQADIHICFQLVTPPPQHLAFKIAIVFHGPWLHPLRCSFIPLSFLAASEVDIGYMLFLEATQLSHPMRSDEPRAILSFMLNHRLYFFLNFRFRFLWQQNDLKNLRKLFLHYVSVTMHRIYLHIFLNLYFFAFSSPCFST